jgi:Xaa-Pro aminopeptidase
MIAPKEYATRREKLLASFDVIVITNYTAVQRQADASYFFYSEANFLYVTGIEAADWQVVVTHDETVLIAPTIDETHQIFDGSLSFDDARKVSGIATILTPSEGEDYLRRLSKKVSSVATIGQDPYADHYDFTPNPAPERLRKYLHALFETVDDCRPLLAKHRAQKSPAEIDAIRRAVKTSMATFETVKERLGTKRYEYEIEAELSYGFRKQGTEGHAYDPIVASAKNACTLHYVHNNAQLPKNGLVLIDAGARADGYAADITRTYAVGIPSEREMAVHEAVEEAHAEIIALIKPQFAVKDYLEQVDTIMKNALVKVDLLKDEDDYRRYFPHAISHGLGLDVHDSLGAPDVFLPGMVLTVEPGIYISEEGIGVRIEDDILVTESGHENLSGKLSTSL